MDTAMMGAGSRSLEVRTLGVGFLLVGSSIAVTTLSYGLNMTFTYQWLVWAVTAAFAASALVALEWPRAFLSPVGEAPAGGLRAFLLLSMPLAFVLGSQVCGVGLKACSAVCHVMNASSIGLAAAIAVRLHRGRSIAPFLIPLVVVGLVPHCVCEAPINVVWHGLLGSVAPTCGMVPLAAVLFSITALRGARSRSSAILAVAMLGVIVFMAVGNPLFGFPWEGCV